ncbi:MAG: VWA domain-containing protein [Myxococcota bacterium]
MGRTTNPSPWETLMIIRTASPRTRRGIAVGAVILSLGGLTLSRAPATAGAGDDAGEARTTPAHGVRFAGPGASGSLALSHGQVLASGPQRVFAELRIEADDDAADATARAPLAMVIALDTSGSMSGAKLAEARRSVARLLERMNDDDEVALVRYDTRASLVQPMARVGDVRPRLMRQVTELRSDGGTNIPDALAVAMREMESAGPGRVRRVVLVSDGLDGHREQSEGLARRGHDGGGVTVSSLGIGLDFDEGYLSGLARAGRGNFGFVQNPATLTAFLRRELDETAGTRIEGTTARLRLPAGVSFVRAVGATSRRDDDEVTLRLGAMPAGAVRRVAIELRVDAARRATLDIDTEVRWRETGGRVFEQALSPLTLEATDDRAAMHASRDGAVYASCVSAVASLQQLEANEAYRDGDASGAMKMLEETRAMLAEAEREAPEGAAGRLGAQRRRYEAAADDFKGAPSPASRAAQKKLAEDDAANLSRPSF